MKYNKVASPKNPDPERNINRMARKRVLPDPAKYPENISETLSPEFSLRIIKDGGEAAVLLTARFEGPYITTRARILKLPPAVVSAIVEAVVPVSADLCAAELEARDIRGRWNRNLAFGRSIAGADE